jgi:multiple sugar transport system permease protein
MMPDINKDFSAIIGKAAVYVFLTILLVSVLFPMIWIVGQSFMPESQILKWPVHLIPKTPTLENYTDLFVPREGRPELPIARWMFNSVFVTSVGTLGALVVASMAAYAFARIEFPGRDLLFMVFGASLLVPGILLLIPNFMLMRSLGWIDTYHALIWPGFAGFFGVFFLRQFFMSIPHELTEAAIIDGCSPFGIYWRVILPLAKPAMATLGIFSFLGIWNDFVWPLIVLNSNEMRTLPVGLAIFNGEYWSEQGIIMAGAVLTSIPVMLVYVIFQRQITKAVLVTGFGGR